MANIIPAEYGELKLVGSRYLAEYDCLSAEIKGKIRAYMREIIQKNELQSCAHFQVPWGIILDEGGYFFGKRVMVSHQKALIEMIGVILREQGLVRQFVIFNNTEVENGQWTVAFVF
jgi:hypothetical protein